MTIKMLRRSFFFKYLSPYGLAIAANTFLRIIAAVAAILVVWCLPLVLSIIFKTDIVGGSNTNLSGSENFINEIKILGEHYSQEFGQGYTLLIAIGLILVLFLIKNAFAYWGMYSFTPIRNNAIAAIRNDVFERLLILPISFFAVHKKGDLISRLSSDIQEVDENILKQVQQILLDFFLVIGFLATLIFLNLKLTLIVILIIPIAAFLTGLLSKSLRKKSQQQQHLLGELNTQIEESIQGIKNIRSYNTNNANINQFKRTNSEFSKIKLKVYRRIDMASPMSEVMGTISIMCVLLVGSLFIIGKNSTLSPEGFTMYLLTLIQIILPAKNIATVIYSIKRGKASVGRLKEILYAEEVIIEKPNAKEIKSLNSDIEFKNLNFSYGDSDVLSNINLKIKKGSTIGIVGASGSGKTTLVNLIPRFFDAGEGELLIDGINIKDYRIDHLRNISAIISQDVVLFNDSVANNIMLGKRGASMSEIISAAKLANAHEFIMALPDNYDSNIGDGGCKLSGGQRQRLSIAQAILKDAPIIIFDEATSALDSKSEKLIQQAIGELNTNKDKIVISIAHRLSTVKNADEIIVIDKGNIVERGTHQDLYDLQGTYYKLCTAQILN